jgi:hypothetical protein
VQSESEMRSREWPHHWWRPQRTERMITLPCELDLYRIGTDRSGNPD